MRGAVRYKRCIRPVSQLGISIKYTYPGLNCKLWINYAKLKGMKARQIGIVGLANVGKSTLFSLLARRQVEIADYPFTTISPNIASLGYRDERLKALQRELRPEKVVPSLIEIADIAGLIKGAHRGEGLGNQFLSQIRPASVLIIVLRGYKLADFIAPDEQWAVLAEELKAKDLEINKRRVDELEHELKKGGKDASERRQLLRQVEDELKGAESFPREDTTLAAEWLSFKPRVLVFNIDGKATRDERKGWIKKLKLKSSDYLFVDVKLELESLELSAEERIELGLGSDFLDLLIRACYDKLNLITIYAIKGGREIRAVCAPQGLSTPQLLGRIHSDFQVKFRYAQVLSFEDFADVLFDWNKARRLGRVRTEGRDYQPRDGDIIEAVI